MLNSDIEDVEWMRNVEWLRRLSKEDVRWMRQLTDEDMELMWMAMAAAEKVGEWKHENAQEYGTDELWEREKLRAEFLRGLKFGINVEGLVRKRDKLHT